MAVSRAKDENRSVTDHNAVIGSGELPSAASTIFRTDGLAYDLAYGLGTTPFLALARSARVQRLADGVGMLVEQAPSRSPGGAGSARTSGQ